MKTARRTTVYALLTLAIVATALWLSPSPDASASVAVTGSRTATAGSGGTTAGRFVKLSSASVAVTATDSGDEVIGVAELTADADDITRYAPAGTQATVTSGEQISVGDMLVAGTGGKAFAADTSTAGAQRIAGVAVTAAGSADEDVTVMLGSGILAADAAEDLTLTAVDDADGTATLTVQVVDADDDDIEAVRLIEVWVGGADDYGEDAITGITISTGTEREEVTANGSYRLLTDADGTAELSLDNNGSGTIYAWGAINDRVYESGEIDITDP